MNRTETAKVKADREPKDRNRAITDQVVSLEEIQTGIKSAEKGPFMTVQEAMNDFEQWLKSWQKRLS
jgi:predicted transcriptional regulator